MATASSSRQQNPSRFSSLKVFKFASSSKPPPLPPKDPYYLYNPSLPSLNHSLSPDSASSQPPTPISTRYATLMRTPSPSLTSTPSRPTASPALSSTALSSETTAPAGFRQGLRKLSSFGRRPKTPKSPERGTADLRPPEPVEDPSISLPWNFQHNVHVDEHCNGLPPTWSTRLADMGLSEEEIAVIQARRAEARSRHAQSIYSLAAPRDPGLGSGNPPSVWRGLSGASSSQTSLASVTSVTRTHQRIVSRAVSSTSDLPLGEDHRAQQRRVGPPPTRPPPVPSQSEPAIMLATSMFTSSKDTRPQTPPRRAYHVANSSLSSMSSPPPAYASPPRAAPPEKTAHTPSASETRVDPPSLPTIAVLAATSSSAAPQLLASPPRLSLQGDSLGDLSSWSESLFSIIPTHTATPVRPGHIPARTVTPSGTVQTNSPPTNVISMATSAGRVTTRSPASARLRAKSHSRSPSAQRNLPPQKPIPLHDLPPRATLAPESTEGTPPPSAKSSPLWAEVMEMVRPAGEARSSESSRSKPTPPLTSTTASSSPYLPRTPDSDITQKDSLQVPPTPTGFSDEGMSDSGHTYESEDGSLQVRSREKENRDSDLSTVTVVPATIVSVSIARSARPNYVASPVKANGDGSIRSPLLASPTETTDEEPTRRSPSPVSLVSSSESSASTTAFGSGSASGSAYTKGSPAHSPRVATFVSAEHDSEKLDEQVNNVLPSLDLAFDVDIDLDALRRPSMLIDDIMATGVLSEGMLEHPVARSLPATRPPRYPGWVTEVVAPLSDFIDVTKDPRTLFGNMREIGEGESGSVYVARVLTPSNDHGTGSAVVSEAELVAIKNVPLVPKGSPKLVDLQRELSLMRGVRHENVLSMQELFVDIVEDALWIKMELMERSLADMLLLVDEGIVIEEKPIALLASDVLHGLSYLQKLGIAHRDLRSDNLLVNSTGVAKIADFSSAIRVAREEPSRTDPVGVIYWQAPEVRTPPYNALKVDVWSLGATVWEMAQAEPPFSDVQDPRLIPHRWPSLHQADIYSRSFHDFLDLCSQPSSLRPDPDDLLKTPFIRNASGRLAILKVLSECRAIEDRASRRQSLGSNGTVSVS